MLQQDAANSKTRHWLAEWALTMLLLLSGTTTIAQAFVIPTGSMEDTLLVGDHLLVDKLTYAPAGSLGKYLLPYQEPQHGDIIVFRYPPNISQTLVKRLIGMPGDRLKIVNGVVYRNGVQLAEPYAFHKYGRAASQDSFPNLCCRPVKEETGYLLQRDMLESNIVNGELVVPPGCYFGMGDNRDNSSDSRYWGFIPRENIIGKPFLIFWSYRASTEELLGQTPASLVSHYTDLAQHFFTRTRWDRTLRPVRGIPDTKLSQDH